MGRRSPPASTISEVWGDHLDGDLLGADPLGAYDASAKAAAAVFAIAGALKAPCAVSYGPVPGAVYAGHRFIDVLIHGWDVAVATRQIAAATRPQWMRASTSSPLKLSRPCVPAAYSVTQSSWRTPAMRKPVCWPRWGDEREMGPVTRRRVGCLGEPRRHLVK